MTTPIKPRFVIDEIGQHLASRGFRLISASANGSRYFKTNGSPFQLRVSNHPWTRSQLLDNHHILVTWCVREPLTIAQIDELAGKLARMFRDRVAGRFAMASARPTTVE